MSLLKWEIFVKAPNSKPRYEFLGFAWAARASDVYADLGVDGVVVRPASGILDYRALLEDFARRQEVDEGQPPSHPGSRRAAFNLDHSR